MAAGLALMIACSSDDAGSDQDPDRDTAGDTCRGDRCAPDLDAEGETTACSGDDDCSGRLRCNLDTGFCTAPCAEDRECLGNQRCATSVGLCVARVACQSTDDCGSTEACNTCLGHCVGAPEGNVCQQDFNCGSFEEYCDPCIARCRPRGELCEPCVDDRQCGEDEDRCITFQDGGQFCGQACGFCPAGFLCNETMRQCVPAEGECGSQFVCTRDIECRRGEICTDNGLCVRGCGADEECPGERVCTAGRCTDPCSGDQDCAEELSCENRRCIRPGGCLTSVDCMEPETYCDAEVYTCVSGCRLDDDCMDATRECLAGRCEERLCTGNFACAFREECDLATGRCQETTENHCGPCDGSDVNSCGAANVCIEGQTEDGGQVGPWCFVACGPDEANPCPQGFQCRVMEVDGGERRVCQRPTCDDVVP